MRSPIEKGNFSNPQLFFLLVGFVLGSNVIMGPAEIIAKHDGWVSILTGLAASLPFMFVYAELAFTFPGKTLIEINDLVYGSVAGKLISIAYLWFFFQLATYNLRDYGDFMNSTVMPKTSFPLIIIMILLVCSFAVGKGIEVIARSSFLIIAVTCIEIFATFFLSMPKMNFLNFLPFFHFSNKQFIQVSHISAVIPFGEPVAFLMIAAFSKNSNRLGKPFVLGIIVGGMMLLIAFVRDIAVLGDTATISVYPSYQAIQLIDLGFLSRLEMIHSVVMLYARVLKICILYYAIVLGLTQLLKLSSYRRLIIPIGILIVNLAIIQRHTVQMHERFVFATEVAPFYFIPFVYLFPLASLLIAKYRNKKN